MTHLPPDRPKLPATLAQQQADFTAEGAPPPVPTPVIAPVVPPLLPPITPPIAPPIAPLPTPDAPAHPAPLPGTGLIDEA